MSSRSTILNHFPSCGPTQTQGSLWGAGRVHFLSNGSQSGPMPACAATASSSHFMLLQALRTRSCLLSSQRRRGVAREAAKPSVGSQSWSLLARRHASNRKPSVGTPVARARCGCSLRQRCGLFVSTAKIFLGAASVFMPLASSVAHWRFWRCGAQPRLQLALGICATPLTALCRCRRRAVASRALVLNIQPTTV